MLPPQEGPYLVIVLLCVLVELVQGHKCVQRVRVCLRWGLGEQCDPKPGRGCDPAGRKLYPSGASSEP